ncbi:helix-turn-helix transcriptional regulator [Pedobacter sp. L105]|uniref:helix-turn-helix transcriptional regulator n=1 Tax=Pedobacter sp. L105 TaxID=1641871 RepID=UPI00131E108E|nr:helix-turn-helix transcriptional regulator [Pedobacter sp. L105]
MNIKYGSSLIKLRKGHNFTQQQIADELFVSRSTYASWESDNNEIPLTKFLKLSKFYNISLVEFIHLIETENHIVLLKSVENAETQVMLLLKEELANIRSLLSNKM